MIHLSSEPRNDGSLWYSATSRDEEPVADMNEGDLSGWLFAHGVHDPDPIISHYRKTAR
jgi:hypothetical protein